MCAIVLSIRGMITKGGSTPVEVWATNNYVRTDGTKFKTCTETEGMSFGAKVWDFARSSSHKFSQNQLPIKTQHEGLKCTPKKVFGRG